MKDFRFFFFLSSQLAIIFHLCQEVKIANEGPHRNKKFEVSLIFLQERTSINVNQVFNDKVKVTRVFRM